MSQVVPWSRVMWTKSVVGADPDRVFVVIGRSNGEKGRVGFHSRLILGDGTTGSSHGLRVGGGKVGTDGFPALTFIGRPPQMLRTVIEPGRLDAGEHDGRGPLKPFFEVLGGMSHDVFRPDIDGTHLGAVRVETGMLPAISTGVEDIRIDGVGRNVAALATPTSYR